MSVQILVACAPSCDSRRLDAYQKRDAHRTSAVLTALTGGANAMKWNNLKPGVLRALWCAIITVVCASSALAQTSGHLVGTIEDAQGAVLPGVTVTVTSPQLQGANSTVTDANGQFRFPTLPPGVYHVKAELAGFKPVDQNDVRIGIDQTITLPLKMQL